MTDGADVAAALAPFRKAAGGGVAFGLERIGTALRELGDPQDGIGPSIHLTGTNGKGSTAAFLRAMAETAGLRVNVFTSPHLVRVNERIRVGGRLVDDLRLTAALERIARLSVSLSYFEALTAAAFTLFAEDPGDVSLIEVGAGGATDATNVMSKPAVCVVAPISRDHEAMFGVSGVEAIARLKAGIFRAGVPVVLAEQPSDARAALCAAARRLGAEVSASGEDWTAGWRDSAFVYRSDRLEVSAPRLGLAGRHQAQNAGAAAAAVEALHDPRFAPSTMAEGLAQATWPARLQRLGPGPLAASFSGAIVIDGAHNPGGASVLADSICAMRTAEERLALVIAVQAAKDIEGILARLAPTVDVVIAVPLPTTTQEGGPGADPADVAAIARAHGARALQGRDLADAVGLATSSGVDRIYLCGSLYLCGAALEANQEPIA